MNLSLLDPFQSDFPEVIEEYLEHKITKSIAFNRRGTLLAAGCTDGTCVIWDFDTRGVAKELYDKDSGAPITSVSWSKCGHRLLSAATDKTISLWDVAKGTRIASVTLQQIALHARLYPGNAHPSLCLACPMSGPPILVDFNSGVIQALPVVVSPSDGESGTPHTRTGKFAETGAPYSPSAASFNKKGDLIYVGNFKGEILIVDTQTKQIQAHVQVPGNFAIRQIVFSRNGQYLLTNSTDRILRVFENLLPRDRAAAALAASASDTTNGTVHRTSVNPGKGRNLPCLRFTKEFQDAVNKMHWKAACFNGDGECVVGASANKGEHKIHIWNRKFGQLARILEGQKEGLADLAWHPTRPMVASVSMSGVIYLWAKDYTENWSAFAPDFKELEENEEYVEREDEFDIMPETEKVKPVRVDDDADVDILTTEKVAAFSDSDNSEDGLYFLPTVPLPDVSPPRPHPSPQPSPQLPLDPELPSSVTPSDSARSQDSEPEVDGQNDDLGFLVG
jgi:COMPASS component SWD1